MTYTTRKSLLEAIRNGDEVSWFDFYDTYRPLILRRGQDYHLSGPEQEELCQEVLLDIFKDRESFYYDPSKGRFRDYLGRMIAHNAIDVIRRRASTPDLDVAEVAEPEDRLAASWDREWQEHLLKQALQMLKMQLPAKQYQAFDLYALQEQPPEKVSRALGVSVDFVYVNKNRAIEMLQKIVKKLREDEV